MKINEFLEILLKNNLEETKKTIDNGLITLDRYKLTETDSKIIRIRINQYVNSSKFNITLYLYNFDLNVLRVVKSSSFSYTLSPTDNCQLSTFGSFCNFLEFCDVFTNKKQIFNEILNTIIKLVSSYFGSHFTKMALIDLNINYNVLDYMKDQFVIKQNYTNTRGTAMQIIVFSLSNQDLYIT